MWIYESMHSLLVLYDNIRNYSTQNRVAKTGPTVAKTGTSTLLEFRFHDATFYEPPEK